MRLPLTIILLLLSLSLRAQQQDGEYDYNHLPVATNAYRSYLEQFEAFGLGSLYYRSRAVPTEWSREYLGGVALNSLSDNRVPYSAIGALYSVATSSFELRGSSGDMSLPIVPIGGGEFSYIEPQSDRHSLYGSVATSSRIYTYRLGAGANLESRDGRHATLIDVSKRFGRSLLVDGLYADNYNITLSHTITADSKSSLNFTALINPSERSYPKASTLEAYALADNNLYNPAWGMQGDQQRSSYVRESFQPIFMATHRTDLGNNLSLATTALLRVGRESYSSLMWQGAPNPLPDYYAYMPSYQSSELAADLIAQSWREDVNSRQINFEELYAINSSGSGRANYIIEDRVTEPLFFGASSRLSSSKFSVGLSIRAQSDHSYKEVASLLGGGYWLDIDTFIEQDSDMKDLTQNNMAEPNREVTEGDIFGYNYRMDNMEVEADAAFRHSLGRVTLVTSGSIMGLLSQRVGYYEKENFPTGGSLGASQSVVGLGGALRADAHYRASGRLSLEGSLSITSLAPRSSQLFIDESYRNALTPNMGNSTVVGIDGAVLYSGDDFRGELSLYYYGQSGATETQNHYDDMLYSYVHYPIYDISTRRMGVEASAEVRLWDELWLGSALILQSNTYTNNPTASAYEQSTGRALIEDEVLFLSGLHLGGNPETIASISLGYRRYNWSVMLRATAFGSAYEVPSPLRYSARVLEYVGSEANYSELRAQNRLNSGVLLDIHGGYRFSLRGGQSIGVYATIGNLANSSDIQRYGYQSDRFYRDGWSLSPQPSKFYYALPLNFSLSATLRL